MVDQETELPQLNYTFNVPNPQVQLSSLQYQLEAQEILSKIESSLSGKVPIYDAVSRTMIFQVPKDRFGNPLTTPMMNELGVHKIMSLLESRLTKIYVLSYFDDEDIFNIMSVLSNNIIDDIETNWDKYNIPDDATASDILHLCLDAVYSTLRKADQGRYLQFLGKTTQAQEVTTMNQNQNRGVKEGILDLFRRKK